MQDSDFEDFMLDGGFDLLFFDDEDKEIECSNCCRVIKGNEQVEWVDKNEGIFKCPECGENLEDK